MRMSTRTTTKMMTTPWTRMLRWQWRAGWSSRSLRGRRLRAQLRAQKAVCAVTPGRAHSCPTRSDQLRGTARDPRRRLAGVPPRRRPRCSSPLARAPVWVSVHCSARPCWLPSGSVGARVRYLPPSCMSRHRRRCHRRRRCPCRRRRPRPSLCLRRRRRRRHQRCRCRLRRHHLHRLPPHRYHTRRRARLHPRRRRRRICCGRASSTPRSAARCSRTRQGSCGRCGRQSHGCNGDRANTTAGT